MPRVAMYEIGRKLCHLPLPSTDDDVAVAQPEPSDQQAANRLSYLPGVWIVIDICPATLGRMREHCKNHGHRG